MDASIEWKAVIIDNILFCVSFVSFMIHSLFSLDCTDYQWTRIGDEGAIALADVRVIKNFKTLKYVTSRLYMTLQ